MEGANREVLMLPLAVVAAIVACSFWFGLKVIG